MSSTTTLLAKCVSILAAVPAMMLASASGPEPGYAGDPPLNRNCTSCHSGTAVNNSGSIAITAADGTTYTPGQKQRLTVSINSTATGIRLYGFQATARLVSNLNTGQAGNLETANAETQVICSDGRAAPCRTDAPVQYIEHRQAKSGNSYVFDWTAPATDSGPIRFFVAGNAANGNTNEGGDRIYTADITLTPTATSTGPKPAIQSSNGVQNGATFEAGIVSGSWATIKGTDLAQTTRVWLGSDFSADGQAPTELDGVKVSIDGKPAAVYFISPTQINVQVPALDKTGSIAVEVTTRNGVSNTATADVRTAAPGWFMFEPDGRKYIAGTLLDGTFLGRAGLFGTAVTSRPARPGDVVVLYGANFGPTNPALPTARAVTQSSPMATTPTVTIGGVNATVQYGGGAPAQIGTYQFNLVVPDVANGDQPVVVSFPSGVRTQENAFITIQR